VTTPVPVTTVQATPAPETPTVLATSPVETTREMTPVRGMPLPAGVAPAAAGIGLILVGRTGRRRD
jgi:hypothetical protein